MTTAADWARMTDEQKQRRYAQNRARTAVYRQDPEWIEQRRAYMREYMRKRRAERDDVREKEREYSSEYERTKRPPRDPEQNRKVRQKADANWYWKNRDKKLAKLRERNQDPEYKARAAAQARERRKKNPPKARVRPWNNPGHPRSDSARAWALILKRDPCSYCGAPMREIDHLDPVVNGAGTEWSNLTAACLPCNRSKGSKRLLIYLANSAGIFERKL